MNLPTPRPASAPESRALISTYTILLLSGALFGMCISGDLPPAVKHWFVFAGTTGLVAYLGLHVVANLHKHTQQRVATMQAEERLDRHAHCDLHIHRANTVG